MKYNDTIDISTNINNQIEQNPQEHDLENGELLSFEEINVDA